MLEAVDAAAVRTWARASLAALGRAREEIDAINVFPVPDGDTGTNLYLTFDAACERLDALGAAGPDATGAADAAAALGALAAGALDAAHGNSGTILAQLLRGVADELAEAACRGPIDPAALAAALASADASARAAVAAPVEGTMLSVVTAAAGAAGELVRRAEPARPPFAAVAEAARHAAFEALRATQDQLPVLAEAGVVDAGARGVCVFFDVLAALVGGYDPRRLAANDFRQPRRSLLRPARVPAETLPVHATVGHAGAAHTAHVNAAHGAHTLHVAHANVTHVTHAGHTAHIGHQPTRAELPAPGLELVFLIETDAVDPLRAELERVCAADGGDSLVVAGGAGRYRVHVHLHQPGPAIEAALDYGRPSDLRISALADHCMQQQRGVEVAEAPAVPEPRPGRAVLAAAAGPGLAELFEEAGAVPLSGPGGRPPTSAQLSRAVLETGVHEVAIITADLEGLAPAFAAADQAERDLPGVRVAVIPGKAAVQAIAALAVHEPGRRFDADVVAMTAAAGATRHGGLRVAVDDAWTMAGIAHAGDVLGFIEDDVALITPTVLEAALGLVDRMVSAGGEMVTLVTGADLGLPTEELVDAVLGPGTGQASGDGHRRLRGRAARLAAAHRRGVTRGRTATGAKHVARTSRSRG